MDNELCAVAFYQSGESAGSGAGLAVRRFPARRMYETGTMRRLLRKVLPRARDIHGHGSLRSVFGRLLLSPGLWHLNRGSVAWAVSIGLFLAWAPVPFQMVLAAGVAIVVRCNLPVAVALVWISNPVTVAPLFFAAYKLGGWMLDIPHGDFRIELSLRWLLEELGKVWEPLLLGCLVMGIASAVLGQIVLRLIWRAHVLVSWRGRRLRRQRSEPGAPGEARATAASTRASPRRTSKS